MDQQTMMQPRSNPIPPSNYPPPPPIQQQQQQWSQQPPNMYPPPPPPVQTNLAQSDAKSGGDSNDQYYYQQQKPTAAPPKPYPTYNSANANNPANMQNVNNYPDTLNSQMSHLSLDGANANGPTPAAPQNVQSNYTNQQAPFMSPPNQNYPNVSQAQMPVSNQQSYQPPPPPTGPAQIAPSNLPPPPTGPGQIVPSNQLPPPSAGPTQIASSNQQSYQPPPPSTGPAQIASSNQPTFQPSLAKVPGQPPVQGYNAQTPQPPVQNYNNYNQQAVMTENWNAYPSSKPIQQQQFQQPNNYVNYDQQTNGMGQNYQQPSPSYGSYQQQPPPPPIAQNFNHGQQPPNRFPMTQQQQPSSYGGQFPSVNQQNKLDPEAMPSAVQVILEDKAKYESNSNVLFTTTVPATVPPLVTTIMENDIQVVEDGGCSRPNFLRPSIYQVPVTEDNLKTSDIPLALVIKPFDDQEVEGKIYVPVTNSEIVRCNRCKAYMNPYNRFIDGGRRFQCSMCHHVTEIPQTYFANLDHTGQRLDKFQRPELFLGSYEFRATEEYCRNNVMNNRRPHFIFACELTETSKPILNYLATNLVDIIKNLPRDPLNANSLPPMFGFVTYNSKIQLYDIINDGHAYVVCDLSAPFPPLNTFLVDPLIHMDKIESFMKSLPSLYANEELEMQTILGPVIEAALTTTQVDVNNWINQNQSQPNKVNNDSAQNAPAESIPVGKVYIFHCTLPTFGNDADTPGRLKQRWTNSVEEIRKLLGTDKEKTILSPDSNKYYVGLGERCVSDFASGIEFFLFPPANGSFLDVATLGELTRLSGTGSIFKYFNEFSDAFLTDLRHSLYSSFAFDCVLKVRTSTGIRAHDYYGNFYSRSPNDIECAAINTNCNIIVDFKYDDKLPEDEHVVIQVATLYTSLSGERRVRLHNMALSTCQQIGDIYRNACCDTVINLIARSAVHNLRKGDKTIQQTKELVINRAINILTSYRKHCAQPGTSLGQLILPEALKLLPMYVCGLLKCDAIDGGPEMNPDDKAYAQLRLLGAFPSLSQVFLYPRLYKIEYENENEDSLKYSQIRCSSHKLNSSAMAYILENGFYVLVLITTGGCANVKFVNGLFGPSVDSAAKIQVHLGLPDLLTNESQFMSRLLKKIESERKRSYKIFVLRQGIDKTESVFRNFLYEDQKTVTRASGESNLEGLSYVDLLCHLHKEIRAQLN